MNATSSKPATCTRATCRAVVRSGVAVIPGEGAYLEVDVEWAPVDGALDRRSTGGWQLRDDAAGRRLAARLVRAVEAGAAVVFKGVKTDVNGRTYVHSERAVFGRHMNADLRRLGF